MARTAMDSGVATRELDLAAYEARLQGQILRTFGIMRGVFATARASARRVVFAEGEDERGRLKVAALAERQGKA